MKALIGGGQFSFQVVEDIIGRKEKIERVLRVVVLISLTEEGLSEVQLEQLREMIINQYGFEQLPLLRNLEKAGLVVSKERSKYPFNEISQDFDILKENIQLEPPSDIGFVHSGYAPISVRVVEAALRPGGFSSYFSSLKLFDGPTVATSQQLNQKAQSSLSKRKDPTEVCLVVYLGGITYSEISALKFLSKTVPNKKIIIASTCVINGNNFIHSFNDSPLQETTDTYESDLEADEN